MLKRLLFVCTLSLLVAAVSSCIFDPAPKGGDPPPPPQNYENLTSKWHVLNNVEVSYNKRSIERYDQLLDENFTFFLSPGDVGGEIPAQWNRADEITYNTRLFDPNYSGAHRCKSIQMSLNLPADKSLISWTGIQPATAPGETWYYAIVFYTFRFDTEPDTQYESVPGAQAKFTVRNTGTDEKPLWKLVEFQDLAEK